MENVKPKTVVHRSRIFSIDIVRGLAIIFMTLDHTRDFFTSALYKPTDLSMAGPLIFLSRWITNFCAPAFVFLAGVGAFLFGSRGRTKKELSFFLFTRGLWIIFLEVTLVQWGWAFNFSYHSIVCQVMWAIGASMVCLSVLIFLPRRLLMVLSIVMIAGHNLFDKVTVESWSSLGWLWRVLHVPGRINLIHENHVFVLYPLIPWIGVMALGYTIGPLFLKERRERVKQLLWLGLGCAAASVLIRAFNVYGDPVPWSTGKDTLYTALSFINFAKYPPSLLFLLSTLGGMFLLLALFDRESPGPVSRVLLIFGRVPMFFYLLHVPAIHLVAVVIAYIKYGYATWLFEYNVEFMDVAKMADAPAGYGYGLATVYLVWISVLVIVFPLCRWYAIVKKSHPQYRLLSYF